MTTKATQRVASVLHKAGIHDIGTLCSAFVTARPAANALSKQGARTSTSDVISLVQSNTTRYHSVKVATSSPLKASYRAFSSANIPPASQQPKKLASSLWQNYSPKSVLRAAHNVQNATIRYTPTSIKQLSAAISSGNFFRVLGIQLQQLAMKLGTVVITAAFAGLTYYTWVTLSSAMVLVSDITNTNATWLLLGLTGAIAGLALLIFRQQWVVKPAQVYDLAMLQLNKDPGIVNVLGLPMVGSEVRACILSGGGLRFKWGMPTRRSQRLHMIFPVKGSERNGIVSLEAKKRWGRYQFKVLAVDIPSEAALGPEERVYVIGDEGAFQRDEVTPKLRTPLMNALHVHAVHDQEDDQDDVKASAEARRQAREDERGRRASLPKPLEAGGGMYMYERLYWNAYYTVEGAKNLVSRWQSRYMSA